MKEKITLTLELSDDVDSARIVGFDGGSGVEVTLDDGTQLVLSSDTGDGNVASAWLDAVNRAIRMIGQRSTNRPSRDIVIAKPEERYLWIVV